MGYLLHTALHFLVGVSISYLLFNKDFLSKKKRSIVFLFGGVSAVSPDVTKFFGDLFGHSIFSVPLFGLLFTIIFRIFIKDFSFVKTWFIFSITVLIGHIFIDYIGNGVAFLFPFVKSEFDFHIIASVDFIITTTLLISVIIGFLNKKGKAIILMGTIIICLYFGFLSISKVQLEHTLKSKYDANKIELLLTYPSFGKMGSWDFQVRTKEVWVNGYSSIYKPKIHIDSEREVDS
ncbi:metal-dependent hydrolase [Bacillus suaedae]|uniref:Metal-dependent hydrolase n=1 Tax=Halalkalibacter suaedae TaxID=2822140 RepID=A0A940WZL1_9BACI|nr:metal-dependent hydrolase [Bacillus suaedae]MBP3951780.1 metal-dependent hydrolase [Bacillus suaedae]